jgi:hypothetical protein
MPIEMGGPFAALMIQQMAELTNLASVAYGRAQYMMRPLQVGDEKPAGSPKVKYRLTKKKLPLHDHL